MNAVEQLHPLEIRTLRAVAGDAPFTGADVIAAAGMILGQCNQAFSWLLDKGLIAERERVREVRYELTELGEQYRRDGLPEERMVALLRDTGPLPMPEIAARLGLQQRDVGSAYGALAREGVLAMDGGRQVSAAGGDSARVATVRGLLERLGGGVAADALSEAERAQAAALSRKRGAARGVFRATETETVSYVLTAAGEEMRRAAAEAGLSGVEVGALTQDMLADGSWREVQFRRYNVNSPPGRVLLGRRNPYTAYLDRVRDQLTALGFEEFDGPLVETNFWCCDALFMPQFHAARDEHDVYFIKEPRHASGLPEPYLQRVAATHADGWQTGSRGWGYRFDPDFARRTILRSHGTVVSAKTLTRAKVPGKYFGIMRCFRPDDVDASHLADFYQTEGIVLGEQVNLKTLLGLLKLFAEEVAGAASADVRYEPAYFPFTEPSVEVFIRHPTVGWIELGGSGIFRPEVTRPLGVDVPVLAWGLGIDRMAMMSLGIDDIRDLFSPDLDQVRRRVAH
ncbi:MAG: phenylalanine--tRNA ligase subunit alpha [Spirochaetaceae bacterium]|nr:phenylalanine--tRNA ligase subunit alpha [Spirochaetaceae bacterium]